MYRRKCKKWGEKICHSSSVRYSERRPLGTVAFCWNTSHAYFSGDETRYRGVGDTEADKNDENKRERDEPCGFSRKVMVFNKTPAYITLDLRSFTGAIIITIDHELSPLSMLWIPYARYR
jgi:hypothetical protein